MYQDSSKIYGLKVHLLASTCLSKWPRQGVPSGTVQRKPKTVHLMVPRPASLDDIPGSKLWLHHTEYKH